MAINTANWSVVAGNSPVQGSNGNIVTTVIATNNITGKTLQVDVPNDGTLPGLSNAVTNLFNNRLANGATQVVAPGTVIPFVIPPVTPPVTVNVPQLPSGFNAWVTAWQAYLKLVRLNTQDVPSATADRVATAKAAHEALYDPSFEAFI